MSAPTRRWRILVLITSTAGGAGLHAYYVARDLPRDRYDVTVAYGPGYPLDRRFAELDVPVVELSLSRQLSPWRNLRGLVEVWRLMRERRFDIVLMETSMAGFVGRVAGALTGVAVRVLVVQVYASRPFQNPVKRALYRLVERAVDPLTTRYIAVSEATRRYGVDTGIFAGDRADVVYNAVTLEDKVPGDVAAARAWLGARPDAHLIGTLSRCEAQKGLDHMLRAAAIVCRQRPEVQFVIVGDGPLRAELEALRASLGLDESAVLFAGWRDDIVRALSAMDVFALSSLWEQAPLAVVEAMAMRLPVVATAVDGTPELVADGETGLLVPPADHDELARALLALVDDRERARRMGAAGRLRAEASFGLRHMVERIDQILDALAREHTGAGGDGAALAPRGARP
ncbi:MAG: glycosyltransferase family 4 protein [Ectothiorhodospiraceae bacterium]|nr:glycosyltransferase family 4 protein [Chromatiales bacterium]MCP5155962.1 glycosyltransferase family 4 protein [Ectothiorhodospiraceae bacterium]